MKFTKIKPYGDHAYTYWISGIYKIVSYSKGQYLSFYIPAHFNNWGNYVSEPPVNDKDGKHWPSLAAAKSACEVHASKHNPSSGTINRADEIKSALIAQAAEYA